jgi:hypothetical protein
MEITIMKIYKLIGLVLTFTFFLSTKAESLHPHPRPARTRIMHGVRMGSLTAAETKRLLREQKQIRQFRMYAIKNDGCIGPRERRMLRRGKARASRHIFRMKHNRFVRI